MVCLFLGLVFPLQLRQTDDEYLYKNIFICSSCFQTIKIANIEKSVNMTTIMNLTGLTSLSLNDRLNHKRKYFLT